MPLGADPLEGLSVSERKDLLKRSFWQRYPHVRTPEEVVPHVAKIREFLTEKFQPSVEAAASLSRSRRLPSPDMVISNGFLHSISGQNQQNIWIVNTKVQPAIEVDDANNHTVRRLPFITIEMIVPKAPKLELEIKERRLLADIGLAVFTELEDPVLIIRAQEQRLGKMDHQPRFDTCEAFVPPIISPDEYDDSGAVFLGGDNITGIILGDRYRSPFDLASVYNDPNATDRDFSGILQNPVQHLAPKTRWTPRLLEISELVANFIKDE